MENESNKDALVSVIIACHNAENYIDDCLESIVSQTYNNLEIIICDDASTDGSYEKLLFWKEKDSRIIILQNEENLFAAATRNKCIEASKGEYLLIHDIDDMSFPNRVEVLLEQLRKEDIDFVSCGVADFNKNKEDIVSYRIPKKEYPTKKSFLWTLPFFHAATLFKRECMIKIGGYRIAPETRRCQDYDMFMRLYAAGYKGKNISDVLYYYRLDEANYKRRTWAARKGEIKIRKQRFKDLGLMPWALPFVYKPVFAHIAMKLRRKR